MLISERVKRRVAAARLAVAFVAAGTIAGATAWAQAGPPPSARSSAVDAFKKAKFDSSNIKNGSLLFQDFKSGQVVSSKGFDTCKKVVTSNISTIKDELGTYKPQFEAIRNDLAGYVKMTDADSRYWKQSEPLVKGDGSVFDVIPHEDTIQTMVRDVSSGTRAELRSRQVGGETCILGEIAPRSTGRFGGEVVLVAEDGSERTVARLVVGSVCHLERGSTSFTAQATLL